MATPTCKKCGGQHYNFVACAEADEFAAQAQAKAAAAANEDMARAYRWGHRNEFAGPRSQNFVVKGGGDQPLVFWRKRGNEWG